MRDSILGVNISAINIYQALDQLDDWLRRRSSHYVCITPAHAIMECYKHPELRLIFNASGMTTPDGMAVVWLMKLRGYRQVERVYGPDLLLASCQAGLKKGYRHFFYGGPPGVAEELSWHLKHKFPGLVVAGTLTPPFRPMTVEEDCMAVEKINATQPDIVWVGLSSPKQEIWMHDHLGKINAPAMLGVGAAFDFLSGRKLQAPYWVQRSGFEWLFRLVCEPKRLWPRYRQYPLFVLLVLGEYLGVSKLKEVPTS
jgi:N-acetylglucosaminyldiphosphoundecaprenol N-acetyl-beta-D-mannosaminyltransferase